MHMAILGYVYFLEPTEVYGLVEGGGWRSASDLHGGVPTVTGAVARKKIFRLKRLRLDLSSGYQACEISMDQ